MDNLGDPQLAYAGRWAGDQCYLVGDYDESNLFDRAEKKFTNISAALAEEYNAFVELDDLKLGRDPVEAALEQPKS